MRRACFLLAVLLFASTPSAHAQAAEVHVVEQGDTLYRLAQRYGISVGDLQRWNDLDGATIAVGQRLRVSNPAAAPPSPEPEPEGVEPEPEPAEAGPNVHVVRPGDTLYGIARQYGVSVAELRRWNDLQGSTIDVDQRLRVGEAPPVAEEPAPPPSLPEEPVAEDQPPTDVAEAPDPAAAEEDTTSQLVEGDLDELVPEEPEPQGVPYTVQPGDTFYALALRLGVPADTLLALNRGRTAPLEAGITIRIPEGSGGRHVVQRGETLSSIARQYGVTIDALRRANDLRSSTLSIGQELRIPPQGAAARRAGTMHAAYAEGRALPYPDAFVGRLTASGEAYDPGAFTLSHPLLPLGTVVLLTTPDGRHAFARVNDRGPVDRDFVVEVSDAVWQALGLRAEERDQVALRLVDPLPAEETEAQDEG